MPAKGALFPSERRVGSGDGIIGPSGALRDGALGYGLWSQADLVIRVPMGGGTHVARGVARMSRGRGHALREETSGWWERVGLGRWRACRDRVVGSGGTRSTRSLPPGSDCAAQADCRATTHPTAAPLNSHPASAPPPGLLLVRFMGPRIESPVRSTSHPHWPSRPWGLGA